MSKTKAALAELVQWCEDNFVGEASEPNLSNAREVLAKQVSVLRLDRMMQIAQDSKKSFVLDKSTGHWFWSSSDTILQGPFDSFFDALKDATGPYTSELM
jgi:hypothetical protein